MCYVLFISSGKIRFSVCVLSAGYGTCIVDTKIEFNLEGFQVTSISPKINKKYRVGNFLFTIPILWH